MEQIQDETRRTQSGQQKRTSEKALDLNGGVDASRFELFKKYLIHLLRPEIDKICELIANLVL